MNPIPTSLVFEYAILFPNGQYYLGPDWLGPGRLQNRSDNPANVGPICNAYTYTEHRAYELIASNQTCFAGCTVVKIL